MRYFNDPVKLLLSNLIGVLSLAAQASDGVTPNQILIGQTLTLQAGKNEYGSAVLQGVQTAIEQANRNGGINGRKIVLKVLDDDNKPAQAEANAQQLITKDKVFLLFGSVEGGPSTAVLKAVNELNVPFFGPMAGSPGLRTPHQPLVFPVRAEHKDEFRALLAHARSIGITRVAFMRSDSETGQQHLANVQRLAKELRIEAVTDLPFKSDINDAGIAAMASKINADRAQMVLNHGGIGAYEKLIRQAKSTAVNTNFYGVNSGSSQLASSLGDLAHGMIFAQVMPSPFERKTGLTRVYQEAFANGQINKVFSYGSLEGYMTGRALVEALKRAGANPTRETFLKGLRNADIMVEDIKISYRDNAHTGMPLVDLAIVTRDGRFKH
jgi:branched-chain amino acid transport system substrate-binding protein